MTRSKILAGLVIALALGGCANVSAGPDSVPYIGSAVHNTTANTYSVTANGITTNLGTPTSPTNGLGGQYWRDAAYAAYAFEDASVIVIGGFNTTMAKPFTGISGYLGAIPTTGSATYVGRIGMALYDSSSGDYRTLNMPLFLDVDFSTATISQDFVGIVISGNITGNTFTGTLSNTITGSSAPLAGGFFGVNTVAAGFAGSNFAGAFLGTKP